MELGFCAVDTNCEGANKLYISQSLSGKTHIQNGNSVKSLCGVKFPERVTVTRPQLIKGEQVCKKCLRLTVTE